MKQGFLAISHVLSNEHKMSCDARHKKTDLKTFVIVIPKEGLMSLGPANPSLGMTPTTEYNEPFHTGLYFIKATVGGPYRLFQKHSKIMLPTSMITNCHK